MIPQNASYGQDLIVRARLMLPQPRRYLLRRPALLARLMEAPHYRLTLVYAGTGYGKTTALLTALRETPLDIFWYSLAESDRDLLLFSLHLIYSFRVRLPDFGKAALEMLQEGGSASSVYWAVINALANEVAQLGREVVLVLDDYHLVNPAVETNALVDYLLEVWPPNAHLVIAARQRPALGSLTRLRVRGDLMEITQQDLAFSAAEIEALFRTQYGLALTPLQAQRLYAETEGWVMALHVIWQSLQSGVAGSLDQILQELPRSLNDLFAYLAQEVLARRPAHIQDFLLRTSVLRQLDPAACDYLLEWQTSRAWLEQLDDQEFFLVRLGDTYRYHHLFHDFLKQQLLASDADRARALHRKAAEFYRQRGENEQVVYHLLEAAEYEMAAEAIVQTSESMVRNGRLDTMSEWMTALPLDVLERRPVLLYRMGELCRFASRFEEALAWYEQAKQRYLQQRDVAGASRALRGQAAVYLDTVRPLKAESLLQEALRLVDGQPDREERARLLDLMAENMTNRGHWEEAESLRQQARALREEGPGAGDLDVRVLLRTGRLDEARRILEERAAQERHRPPGFREPRAHRETLLVLALIDALQGRPRESFCCAREGIEIGRQLGSPFVEAVGYMRLGHAWQVSNRPDAFQEALACYQRAIEIGERLAVARTKVEAMWGLCRLYGFSGNLVAAEQCASEGREIGLGAGDEWIAALIDLGLGASYVLAGQQAEAQHWLSRAAATFQECGDPFGQTVARLWQCVLYQKHDVARLAGLLEQVLESVQAHSYEFLFERPTFLGPNDPAVLMPLLVVARQKKIRSSIAAALLARLGLPPDLEFHPGYTVRVRALGRFEVYCGQHKLDDSAWRREKARQLFQVLLINRPRFMERDELAEILWPGAESLAAFKVTLNALQQTLEPTRPPRAPSCFVQRRGSAYRLDPAAPLWLDADEFERLIEQGNRLTGAAALEFYQQALALYEGNLLPDCLYADWCRDAREHLRQLYLATVAKVGEALLAQGEEQATRAAIHLCNQALVIDNCDETLYRLLIRAHLQQRDFVQAIRVYERCVACLREELDVAPMPETTALYQEVRQAAAG